MDSFLGPLCAPSGAFLFSSESFGPPTKNALFSKMDHVFEPVLTLVHLFLTLVHLFLILVHIFLILVHIFLFYIIDFIIINYRKRKNGPKLRGFNLFVGKKLHSHGIDSTRTTIIYRLYYFSLRIGNAFGPRVLVHPWFLPLWRVKRNFPVGPLKLFPESGFLEQMNEIQSNTQIVNSIKKQWFAHKLMDMPNAVRTVVRFMPSKPFDIFAFIHGKGVGIETKLLKTWKGFSTRFLRENQIEALDEVLMAGGRAFVFVHVHIPANVVEGTKRVNRLIILDWAKWDQKLIRKKDLMNYPYIEGKKGTFDLSSFFLDIKNGK